MSIRTDAPSPESHAAKRPLRVGLVGAGFVTQHHLAAWSRMAPQARVVAIADPDTAAARTRAGEYGIAHVFPSAGHLLDEADIDALDVAAPREFHAEIVRLACRKGLPVLCQKPLAPTLREAEALVEEVQGNIRLMVHENWRFRPYYRDIAEWLRSGRIGVLLQAQACLFSSGLLPDEQGRLPALVRQPFIAGLDRALVMEVLIHHIDTLRFLLGELRLAYSRLGRVCSVMKGEDHALLVFETTGGAPVSLISNLAVHGQPPGLVDHVTLIGTRGTIVLEGNKLSCFGDHPCEQQYDLATCYSQSYASAISHFAQCLRTGEGFETSPADNLRTLALVEAVYVMGGQVK